MAHVDSETGRLHLHVVYDGAPWSGKTTSLWALARRFGRSVETPEERQGRTLYFDWLDVAGGRYREAPIQCRIIAVPGQLELAARRNLILEAADAVVFVADTTADRFAATLAHHDDLLGRLSTRDRTVPVVAQLNKRDAEDVIDLAEVRARFVGTSACTFASVATDGAGVQEAFVLAVGEAIRALRRVESAHPIQPLPEPGHLDLADPVTLYEQMVGWDTRRNLPRDDST
ncbi:MAG: GTPase domain-containing protein [Acidobacteriota bacterium]